MWMLHDWTYGAIVDHEICLSAIDLADALDDQVTDEVIF